MEILIVIGVVLVIVAIVIAAYLFERKRRRELEAVAAKLGLVYSGKDGQNLAAKFSHFSTLAQGENRYAQNTITGTLNGRPVFAFDYHYETHTHDSKGRRRTQHHYVGSVVIELDCRLKPLFIRKEGFFDKIAAAVGFEDIDFESHEFSKKFYVKSQDRKFAYDVIHPRMMEFLLANPEFAVELGGNSIIFYKTRKLKPAEIEPGIKTGEQFIALIPEFVIKALKENR
jgi:hypothetical protein